MRQSGVRIFSKVIIKGEKLLFTPHHVGIHKLIWQEILYQSHKNIPVLSRLLEVYKNKVNSFTQLTDAVLAHHHKSPQLYTVLVQDQDVSIIPKSEVPQDQRFPKVCVLRILVFSNNFQTIFQSPDSLQYRGPPLPPPEDPYNGNMMFNQNHHSNYIDHRAWE